MNYKKIVFFALLIYSFFNRVTTCSDNSLKGAIEIKPCIGDILLKNLRIDYLKDKKYISIQDNCLVVSKENKRKIVPVFYIRLTKEQAEQLKKDRVSKKLTHH